MEQYLAFIDEVGNINDEYVYRFDFTYDSNTVWGEYFNIIPTSIVPNIQPDKNCLSSSFKIKIPYKLILAKKNNCFSMQDCIDGIIPMGFSNINDDEFLLIDNKPALFRFGEQYETIINMLNASNIEIYDKVDVKTGDDSAIDSLINSDVLTDEGIDGEDGEFDDDNNDDYDF